MTNCQAEGGQGSICLTFGNPNVKTKGALLWLHDAFPGKTVKQKTSQALAQIGQIDVGSVLPTGVRDSFVFSRPVVKGGTIGFPMNLRREGDPLRTFIF